MEIIKLMLKLKFPKSLIYTLLGVSVPTISRVEKWEEIKNSERIKAINWNTNLLIDKMSKAHYQDIL